MEEDAQANITAEQLKALLLAGLDGPDPVITGGSAPAKGRGIPAWVPPPCQVIQNLVPDLKVESFVGRGGMGAVYRCVDPALHRPVAIKLLPPELAKDPETMERFSREGKAMACLRHEHIVTVYRCLMDREHPMLVMEFVEGSDLAKLIAGSRAARESGAADPLPLVEGLRIFTEVCAALGCAHAGGILHRDIKPANILLDGRGRARVADFGLARPVSREEAGESPAEKVIGSLAYMAPEQLRGLRLDYRTDIFALGVVLHEIITGYPPGGVPPGRGRPGIPRKLPFIAKKAMAQDPDSRWQSTEEMAAAVEKVRACLIMPPWRRFIRCAALPAAALAAAAAGLILLPNGEKMRDTADAVTNPPGGPGAAAVMPEDPPGTLKSFQGQKLVPVPGMPRLLAGMWEVRAGDFEEFVRVTGYQANQSIKPERREFEPGAPVLTWQSPGREQTPAHPVTCVSWDDADAFCQWLTETARTRGEITAPQEYRMLTDREWSAMAAVPPDAQPWLWERTARPAVYSWGTKLPKPPGWENHAATDTRRGIAGPVDIWPQCAPVGSLRRTPAGFHDLGGNVREWILDCYDFAGRGHAARSSGFRARESLEHLSLARRSECWLDNGNDTLGFRLCLDLKNPATAAPAAAAEAAVLKFHGGKLPPHGSRARAWVTAEGMRLDLTRCTGPGDVSAFSGLPVRELFLGPAAAGADFSLLRIDALRRLYVKGGWPQFQAFSRAPLEYLTVIGSENDPAAAVSLEGLNTQSLRGVTLTDFPELTDISVLAGAPELKQLFLVCTGVSNLKPLAGLALSELDVTGSPVDAGGLLAVPLASTVPFAGPLLAPAWTALHRGETTAAAAYLSRLEIEGTASAWFHRADWRAGMEAAKALCGSLIRTGEAGGGVISGNAKPLTFGGSRYLLLPGRYFPQQAWWMATVLRGHPAAPSTEAEMNYLIDNVTPEGPGALSFHLGAVLSGAGAWTWCNGEPWGFTLWESGRINPGLMRAGFIAGKWQPLWNRPLRPSWRQLELADASSLPLLIEWTTPQPDLQALRTALARKWIADSGKSLTLHSDGRVGDESIGRACWYATGPESREAVIMECSGMKVSTLTLDLQSPLAVLKTSGGQALKCQPAD